MGQIEKPMGDSKIADLIASQNSETGIALNKVISEASNGITSNSVVQAIINETGNEIRPANAILVIWVGGTTQPVNMGPIDLWAHEGTVTPPTDVDTDPSVVGTTYSVFGDAPYPYPVIPFNEDPIKVANAFYTMTDSAIGWRCVGARFYLPEDIILPTEATFELHTMGDAITPVVLSNTPLVSAIMQNISPGWNEVLFPTAIELTPGIYYWISYNFGNGQYIAFNDSSNSGFVASSETTNFVEADGALQGGNLPTRGAYYYIGGAHGQNASQFSVDMLIDKGA